MKQKITGEMSIPEGVNVSVDKGVFVLKGKKGELNRKLSAPGINSKVEQGKILFEADKGTKNEKKLISTYIAHLKNLVKGVEQGHVYKLKICSGHFPMTASIKGNVFELKNFFGEVKPRKTSLPEGVNVKIDGQYILLEGIDKETLGKAASVLELLTRRYGFDKRIFQDGIFLVEKDGKPIRI